MAAIWKVAKDSIYFDSATISPDGVTNPILGAKWAQNVKGETESCLYSIRLLDRLHTFACIA